MSKRGVTVTILCEDLQHDVFARRLLECLGFPKRRFRSLVSPAGKGSGEQFVRSRYADEVKGHRRYVNRSALVVLIDADRETVENRHRVLDNSLQGNHVERRRNQEPIAILVPKRNIETWIHYLLGSAVNEQDDYPRLAIQRDCQPAVELLREFITASTMIPSDCPPSLVGACEELRRILPT